jgi:hypothetical protein
MPLKFYKEGVMLFVNEIGDIVHGIVDQFLGPQIRILGMLSCSFGNSRRKM